MIDTEPDGEREGGTGGDTGIPIVAIGSSAGGIGPLKRLFASMPIDLGAAYVLIPHLSPSHESQIPQIVGNVTEMPVKPVLDRTPIESDHVYVIAPGRYLTIEGDDLTTSKQPPGEVHRRPVDLFFESLARCRGHRAIAIILSGMDANGSAALREIKGEGGFVIAQDPDEAEFPGMPETAMGSGQVDLVLTVAEMPTAIQRVLGHPYVEEGEDAPLLKDAQLNSILQHLQMEHGQDFWNYKRPTLRRRILRRMSLGRYEDGNAYFQVLRKDHDEGATLVRDLLISVTDFFRDPLAWQALKETVLSPLVQSREPRDEVRIWCAGCATGEEPYSMAMLMAETMDELGKPLDVKIFATDTATHSLAVARAGTYAQAALDGISADRLERFFDRQDDLFRVKKPLRNMVIFAEQNLLRDPPFTRIDLMTCRNLLIYLTSNIQQNLIAIMHFALKPGGTLFLGGAEQAAHRSGELFSAIDPHWRIYRREGQARPDLVDVPRASQATTRWREGLLARKTREGPELARMALLDALAPPSVLIDRDLNVLYFHGATQRFLTPPRGEPTSDLTEYCDGAVSSRLRGLVYHAARLDGETVEAEMPLDGHDVRLRVTPVAYGTTPRAAEDGTQHFVVSFSLVEKPAEAPRDEQVRTTPDQDLATENTRLRAELRDTIEQMHGTNEELKASNEEAMSINEELRSANEELETSKEELQSMNEEMNTVNAQLGEKIDELEAKSHDLGNLLNSSGVATVFLDKRLKIRWFSPAVQDLMELLPGDVGRSIEAFGHLFERDGFVSASRAVLRDLVSRIEICSRGGKRYECRLHPYRADDRIEGVVLSFIDVTEISELHEKAERAQLFAEAIVETVRHPLVVLDRDLRLVSANSSFHRTYGFDDDSTRGTRLQELGGGAWNLPELLTLMNEVLPQSQKVEDFEVSQSIGDERRRVMLLNARMLGDLGLILLAIEDISEQSLRQRHNETLIGELNHRVKNLLNMVQSIAQNTLSSSPSPESFVQSFMGRLQAIASSHDLIFQARWMELRLASLAESVLEPFRGGAEDRIAITDDAAVRFGPQTALTLTLILHELATNAVKYGALSTEEGRVAIESGRSMRGGDHIFVRWRETGGPAVSPPTERGFGLGLIEGVVAYEMNGEVHLDFQPEGLTCTMRIPVNLAVITASEEAQ